MTLLFEGTSWDRLKHVFVDREGEHIYALRPKVEKVTHRLLCDVKLVDNVKVVTFRSTFLIENKSLVNAEMVIVDEHGKRASQIFKIGEWADAVTGELLVGADTEFCQLPERIAQCLSPWLTTIVSRFDLIVSCSIYGEGQSSRLV